VCPKEVCSSRIATAAEREKLAHPPAVTPP
jgi:hypothetical protein